MKQIVSYNVNGIRAALNKGFAEWLKVNSYDIICLQETKAHPSQINTAIFEHLGYHHYWFSAQKKGYSGVAILTKEKPNYVETGIGKNDYDCEGRIIRLDFDDFSVISAYFPSGTSGDRRQAFKMQFLDDFRHYISRLIIERPKLIISGDYNICHKPIDIHDPVRNAKNSGFLPEEREWVTQFLSDGFIDTFRTFEPGPDNYSWWTYRANARARNLGWRLDYNMASESLKENLADAAILNDIVHSDHCPVYLKVNF